MFCEVAECGGGGTKGGDDLVSSEGVGLEDGWGSYFDYVAT